MSASCRIYVYTEYKEFKWVEDAAAKKNISVSKFVNSMIKEKKHEEETTGQSYDPEKILKKLNPSD